MLKVDSISCAYHNHPVLEHISFELPQGEHLALLGESGSGKSTLLKAIYGMLHIQNGAIHWGDKKVLGPNFNLIPGESYMKYVAQDLELMPYTTVSENVGQHLSVFHQEEHQARIAELLEIIEMQDYAHVKVSDLSGGQKQRVSIARSLITKPKVILADEPTGALDTQTSFEVMDILKEVNSQGITVIIVTHEHDIAGMTKRIIRLRDGIIESEMKPQEKVDSYV